MWHHNPKNPLAVNKPARPNPSMPSTDPSLKIGSPSIRVPLGDSTPKQMMSSPAMPKDKKRIMKNLPKRIKTNL
jgi:hypothetical protein